MSKELIDGKLVTKATENHAELAVLLGNAPLSVANLARLMCLATKSPDFVLSGAGPSMTSKNFVASIVQVTSWGSRAFIKANTQFDQIKMTSEKIPTSVKDMLDNTDDMDYLKQSAEAIASLAQNSETYAKEVCKEFEKVVELINEVFVQFVATKGDIKDFENGVRAEDVAMHDALMSGMKQLGDIRNKWEDISKFFTKIASILTVDMLTDTAQFRSVSQNYHVKRFADKSLKVCMTSLRITLLAEAYLNVSTKYLEGTVKMLLDYVSSNEKDTAKFEALEKQCLDAAVPIGVIIADSKLQVPLRLRELVTELKG